MGLRISSSYIKTNSNVASSKNISMETNNISQGMGSVQARVIQGGGKTSYYLTTYGVIFTSTDGVNYNAEVPTRYIGIFIEGKQFTIGCGCGGQKKTILQII